MLRNRVAYYRPIILHYQQYQWYQSFSSVVLLPSTNFFQKFIFPDRRTNYQSSNSTENSKNFTGRAYLHANTYSVGIFQKCLIPFFLELHKEVMNEWMNEWTNEWMNEWGYESSVAFLYMLHTHSRTQSYSFIFCVVLYLNQLSRVYCKL